MVLRGRLDGGRCYEGPRWHASLLWFVDRIERTLLRLGLISYNGRIEVHNSLLIAVLRETRAQRARLEGPSRGTASKQGNALS
jgi:hypothetical protein